MGFPDHDGYFRYLSREGKFAESILTGPMPDRILVVDDEEAIREIVCAILAAAGYTWAFAALTASPGARAHYDRRRDTGDRHAAAERNLFGRLLGCLHKCLITGQDYDEDIAFPDTIKQSRRAA